MRAPIVGVKFALGSSAIIAALGQDTPLILEPEPENPHHQEAGDALAVKIAPEYIPRDPALEIALQGYGLDLATLTGGGPIRLGYIPAKEAKSWEDAMAASSQHTARLAFDPTGKAMVELQL